MSKEIRGEFHSVDGEFVIVAARWNEFFVEHLVEGAKSTLAQHGISADRVTVVRVPGSFEIPLVCKRLAETGSYSAIIAVGAVIRGATSHYDLVCNEAAKGLSQVSMSTGVPVTFGIVTAENLEQAIERSGSKAGNKGAEAALAAIELVSVLKQIE